MPGTKEVETPDTVVTGPEGNDEFGAAFGASAAGEPIDDVAETPKLEGAAAADADPDADKTESAKAGDAAEPDETGTDDKPEDFKHKFETLQGMYAKDTKDLQDKLKELEAKINAKQDAAKPEPKDENKAAQDELAQLIEEDDELKEFVEEYDYLAKPLRKFLGKIMTKKKAPDSTNDEAIQKLSAEIHFGFIAAKHPDFNDLVKAEEGKPSKLETFVTTYAGSDKAELESAYQKGNAQQVIKLVDRYKESLKKDESVDEVKAQRQKKLADLAAVPKKDGAINTDTKKKAETFGEAFAEAASK